MQAVGTIERSGKPRRAILASALLLIGTAALAGTLSGSRHRLSLGPRISPGSWPVSFQPPEGWTKGQSDADRIEYHDRRDPQNPKEMVMRLTPNPSDWSAGQLAGYVMTLHLAGAELFGEDVRVRLGGMDSEDAPLGRLPGARIHLPDSGDYVHVGLLPSKLEPAVVLEYHTAGPFSPRDTRLSGMLADSVAPK